MEYRILEASSNNALTELVYEHLADGWQLQGGVSVATYSAGSWWYFQAMVRPNA